ncbi:hypothetical protein [Streptomyces sp. NPDC017890]|uniref:hypothetical protein n=1 Tax=Streptomyces sp. NPDC017890 TaxID=3365015 RepID=UPI00378E6E63
MYAFKMGLYEFLHGVHRKRLAGRMHMDPSTLSRTVNKNQRITEADLDRLIAAVQTSERTPTMHEVAYLRDLVGPAPRPTRACAGNTDTFRQQSCADAVVALAGRHQDREWAALAVANEVDFVVSPPPDRPRA